MGLKSMRGGFRGDERVARKEGLDNDEGRLEMKKKIGGQEINRK